MPPHSSDLPMATTGSYTVVRLNGSNVEDVPAEESQQTQTQLTQPDQLTPDELSQLCTAPSSQTPLSPPPILPWGRLVPCVPSTFLTAVNFMPMQTEYWIGRSKVCDIQAQISGSNKYSKEELVSMDWAKAMISNRHCRIFQDDNLIYIEDTSGNGTLINQQTHLRKGMTRVLHSGDEICLVNAETIRKRITSSRVLQLVLQQFSFIFVQSKPRKPCVNPRAMNYVRNRTCSNNNHHTNTQDELSPRSSRRVEHFYELREVLGDGTSGQVRRAIHRESGLEYAVKIISLRRQLDMSMMEREVQLLQTLDHPYITSLVDVFVQPAVAMYIVMELVKGGDLFDRIVEKQCYTQVEARRTMRRLLSAVYYLHEHRNIVHRDLKPENVLCSSATHVKLADFGLAKIVKADGLKTFCGTPAYFAPEVLERRSTVAGQGRYGKPADIWSLGVILYVLLTGRPPFDTDVDETDYQSFQLDFMTDQSVWNEAPMAQELVQQMLRLDPKRRLTIRQCCDHPWFSMDDGDTHCHPLDDPAITTKKRLFEEEDDSDPPHSDQISRGEDESMDDSSVRSKDDSILSKEEFAHAAVSHHARNESFFNIDSTAVTTKSTEKRPNALKKKEVESQAPVPVASDVDPKHVKQMSIDSVGVQTEGLAMNNTIIKPLQSNNPDAVKPENAEVDDPSNSEEFTDDSFSPPRSPLANLNLNDRCNRFRDEVLQSTCDKQVRQTAVTPTSSNVRKIDQYPDLANHAEEEDESGGDPILSQFSDEPSSIESFDDSSDSIISSKGEQRIETNSTNHVPHRIDNPSAKKRKVELDTVTPTTKTKSKRARVSLSNSKQMTLTSWFVKKDEK